MGFGIALIGYAFLLLQEVGGGFFAALILGYGFFLASRLNGNFLRASVSALFMIPRGVLQILTIVGIVNLENIPLWNTVTFLLYIAAWMFMSYFWLTAVIQIAQENNSKKFENQARNRLVITVGFLMFAAISSIMNITGSLGNLAFMISAAQYILQYIIIFVNLLFLHKCFIMITGERQYEKDKQLLARERAKSLEKSQKEHREVSERIEKRK